MDNCNAGFDLLIETSWEVCNKIGGIYTVLSTKAATLQKQHKDKTIFIGPDVWSAEHPSPYFVESRTLLKKWLAEAELPEGVDVRVGRWDIPGKPIVVLVKFDGMYKVKDEFYGRMWQLYGVDSLHAYGDYDEACAFSHAAGIVARSLAEFHIRHKLVADPQAPRIISHCDEWTTGMALLYIKSTCPQVATVFTTHATSIGRSICGNGKPLYDYFHQYNGDQMAEQLNMQSKHSLEKAAAHNADCFTTVSEVTARECEQLLQIRPQVVTPNGFEPEFVPKTVKYNRLRKEGRDKLLEVAAAVTGRKYDADTFIIATSGRHEYRNKGLNMFIDTMAHIEAGLPSNEEALAFIMVPGWVREPQGALVTDLKYGGDLRPEPDFLTHSLNNEGDDEICRRIKELEAAGHFRRLKVIYVPSYLDGADGVIDISYYDLLPAFDLTIFPSYYEPWGYTPLESVAFGVPTITDDKAGFGQWVLDNFKNGLNLCGVDVKSRNDSNYGQACREIADDATDYISEDNNLRLQARNMAFLTSAKADWKFFILNYDKAFEIALQRNMRR